MYMTLNDMFELYVIKIFQTNTNIMFMAVINLHMDRFKTSIRSVM